MYNDTVKEQMHETFIFMWFNLVVYMKIQTT